MSYPYSSYPLTRPRRLRQNAFIRDLVCENTLTASDLIYPVFIQESAIAREPVASMPGVDRLNLEALLAVAEKCLNLKIPAIALFPAIDSLLKTDDGREALNLDGLVPRAVAALKARFPELLVMADVALDPYTTHGQDGLIDEQGKVLNDETVKQLVEQALCLAAAGADIVAPSDMMDGRIGAIRKGLEAADYQDTLIMAYSAKYASAFYGPFRDAVRSKAALGRADKRTYQMNPANTEEALHEVALDLSEGADMVMVKPGMPYLDVIARVSTQFGRPTFAYQVSGEYSMIQAAAAAGYIERDAVMLESLLAFKRAGACGVLSYFALEAAALLAAN